MSTTRALTPKEVAERIGFSVRTVKEMLKAGLLPGIRPGPGGREWRVLESDLEAYLQRGKAAVPGAKGPEEGEVR